MLNLKRTINRNEYIYICRQLNIDKIGIRHDWKEWLQMAFQVDDVSPASRKILEVLVAEAFHKRNLGVVDEKRILYNRFAKRTQLDSMDACFSNSKDLYSKSRFSG